jgi:hypothetical protein
MKRYLPLHLPTSQIRLLQIFRIDLIGLRLWVTQLWNKSDPRTGPELLSFEESSDLEPGVTEINLHAPGIGQVVDNDTKLVSYGFVK